MGGFLYYSDEMKILDMFKGSDTLFINFTIFYGIERYLGCDLKDFYLDGIDVGGIFFFVICVFLGYINIWFLCLFGII